MGAAAGMLATAPIFSWVHIMNFVTQLKSVFRVKGINTLPRYFCVGKGLKQQAVLPLMRNIRPLFPHTFCCLSAGNPLPAIRAVFDIV